MALLTTEGLNRRAELTGGISVIAFEDFILGSDTDAEAVGIVYADLTIITTNGGERGVADAITLEAGSVCQWVKAYTFTGILAINQFALAEPVGDGNKLCIYHKFASTKNVVNLDTATITVRLTES